MRDISNREIQKLFDSYNPNKIAAGDIVNVRMGSIRYLARIVGLDLDIKNKKVFANLKLLEQNKQHPIKVDVTDCTRREPNLYPGHHRNG